MRQLKNYRHYSYGRVTVLHLIYSNTHQSKQKTPTKSTRNNTKMSNCLYHHEAHYGEEEAVDREWEEFAKLVEMKNKRIEEQRNTFYPSPQQEEDYESTIVSATKTKTLAKF